MTEDSQRGTEKYRLELTEAEEKLLAQIDLRSSHSSHAEARAAYLANQEPILELLKSLSERGAVPQQRLNYWNHPDYHPGRLKGSRKQIFERNGCHEEEIYTHPNFVKHLRYIVLGADLPRNLIEAFEAQVGDPQWISYSDALELGKFARGLVRRHRLDPREASEEFFKLALDLDLGLDSALRIRSIVKATR